MATARSTSAGKPAEVVAEESATVEPAAQPVTIEQVRQRLLDAMAEAVDSKTGYGMDLPSAQVLADIYATLEGK